MKSVSKIAPFGVASIILGLMTYISLSAEQGGREVYFTGFVIMLALTISEILTLKSIGELGP